MVRPIRIPGCHQFPLFPVDMPSLYTLQEEEKIIKGTRSPGSFHWPLTVPLPMGTAPFLHTPAFSVGKWNRKPVCCFYNEKDGVYPHGSPGRACLGRAPTPSGSGKRWGEGGADFIVSMSFILQQQNVPALSAGLFLHRLQP